MSQSHVMHLTLAQPWHMVPNSCRQPQSRSVLRLQHSSGLQAPFGPRVTQQRHESNAKLLPLTPCAAWQRQHAWPISALFTKLNAAAAIEAGLRDPFRVLAVVWRS